MVDFRAFLGSGTHEVLPWFGGPRLHARDRVLSVKVPPLMPGWYRWAISGRTATCEGPSDAPDVTHVPRVTGVYAQGRLYLDGRQSAPLALMPAEHPPLFAPVEARRWYSGDLIFETTAFESETEDALRVALAKSEAISTLKHVTPAMRSAWAQVLARRESARLHIPASEGELRRYALMIADQGVPGAEQALRALAAERELAQREWNELQRARAARDLEAETARLREDQRHLHRHPEARARAALEKAGATLESLRLLRDDCFEVVFSFMNERFISLVEPATLRIIDSGICLGHPPRDDLITLESLPSVIREAIDDDLLVILRHP